MRCQDLDQKGILDEIANIFNNEKQARMLLGKMGFPKNRIPDFDVALDFWHEICAEIENGLLRKGPSVIITTAADLYPYNNVFSSLRNNNSTPVNRNHPTVIISVSGFEDSIELLEMARRIASARHIPGEVGLGLVRGDSIVLQLSGGNMEHAAELARELEAAFSHRQRIQTSYATEEFRDYLIESMVIRSPNQRQEYKDVPASSRPIGFIPSDDKDFNPPERPDLHGKPPIIERAQTGGERQTLKPNVTLHQSGIGEGEEILATPNHDNYSIRAISVEGPDQGRFELTDVPAATPLKDIARATISEYDDKMWPQDRSGHARSAVVDKVHPDGTSSRLNPDSTVHDNRIRTGDALQVSPQSTAGSLNPLIREEALARVRSQVLAYAKSHPGFEVSANATVAPTEYLFKFKADGWGPPSVSLKMGGKPYPVETHEVFLRLPPDFPMKAPEAFWQTPVFHPNIHPFNNKVCLGALEDQYRPGLDFGKLCQLLVDIARYQNYEVREYYNQEAREWAVSPEGEKAIEERGGKSITHWIKGIIEFEEQPLPSLKIRRCD